MDKPAVEIEEFLKIRREAALEIDPETAEVEWTYGQMEDPYGLYHLRPEEQTIGREYFARTPGSNVWVSFGDLPEEARERLWELHGSKLAFPAGLFDGLPPEVVEELFGADKKDG
jgi:hypothetical protein